MEHLAISSKSAKAGRDDDAARRIRALGQRITVLRVAVLRALLRAGQPLSHQEIQQRVENQEALPIDRVSLYRNLEWLVQMGLAHRITADDRVWRFSARRDQEAPGHPHFHCTRCGQVFCLVDATVAIPAVPSGYEVKELEVVLNGLCPPCGRHAADTGLPGEETQPSVAASRPS
ncbi:Fur family transcriptional regulator [Acidithiobacillus sp.]